MSEVEENEEDCQVEKKASKAETTLARAKAATMIIGALATAATAIWGAIRQPPEPGAKIAYEVLKEALLQERNRYDKLADEVEELRGRVETTDLKYEAAIDQIKIGNSCSGKRLTPTNTSRSPASVGNVSGTEEIIRDVPEPNQPKTKGRRREESALKLPEAIELGL